jgi:presequence protease
LEINGMSDPSDAFELVKETEIQEYKTLARLLRHKRSGAQLLSLENDDTNKVFGITFRTPPLDSSGLPHILEHSVLGGSRKYPLKNPFMELEKGSLKTFLNAMTFSDKTTYPVASQNQKDFYNLVDVYLDAVFFPLLKRTTFQQEGWHYELEASGEPLVFKGVVFNEMKGYYSSPDMRLGELSQHSLFPDNVYSNDPGGDPQIIPELTYERFKDYHAKYYHPSNARIFFYGDDDPQERLRILDAYLSQFDYQALDTDIPDQPLFSEPRRLSFPYDPGEEQAARVFLTVNWLLAGPGDPVLSLGLNILAHILVGTPASPLRKALIESGLGEDLTGRGLDADLAQMYFSSGLKGIPLQDTEKVERLILSTLQDLSKDGIDPHTVAASMNTVEFRLRENNTGSLPRGLILMLRSLGTWLYGHDPLAPLAFETPLSALKNRLQAGERYFEGLIEKYFIQNQHRTTVILEPDPELGFRLAAREQERLQAARSLMSEAELQEIVEETHDLRSLQEQPDPPQAKALLPTLKKEDLEPEIKRIPLEVVPMDGTQVLYHDLFTNGIFYLNAGFNLESLPSELLPYLPLFSRALLEMGTHKEDYVRLSQRIGRTTGGIGPSLFTSAQDGGGRALGWIFLSGKSTLPQVPDLLEILTDILTGVRLDNRERFRQMVLEAKAEHESGLVPAGHAYVNRRLKAAFNPADYASEQMSGLSQLFFLRRLAGQVESDWPSVLANLEDLRSRLISRRNLLLNVTTDQDSWNQARPPLEGFLETLPDLPVQSTSWATPDLPPHEGLVIPAQVNYVGKGANLYDHGYQMDGSILVVTPYLRSTYLHEKVRVLGGAYGGFCLFDRFSGVFSFLSYRDPNLAETLDAYDHAGEFLRKIEISEDELTKALIGAVGDMDAYQLPDAQGYTSMLRYLLGVSDEDRQQRRDQALSTTQEDFRRLGEVLGEALASKRSDARITIMGSQAAISKASSDLPESLQQIKVL